MRHSRGAETPTLREGTPNLPTNIVPANIARLKLSGKSPMDVRIPPLKTKIMLESNPPKPTMLVGRLGVWNRVHMRVWLYMYSVSYNISDYVIAYYIDVWLYYGVLYYSVLYRSVLDYMCIILNNIYYSSSSSSSSSGSSK